MAMLLSGYLQEENASKNHLLTLKLTSLLGIEAPKGKTVLGWGGEEENPCCFCPQAFELSCFVNTPRGSSSFMLLERV